MDINNVEDRDPVLYISGPMTGIADYNYPLFNSVAKKCRENGAEVISPAEFFGGGADKTRVEYMRASFEALLKATHIVLLPDWDTSKGAVLEYKIAVELGLFLTDYEIAMAFCFHDKQHESH